MWSSRELMDKCGLELVQSTFYVCKKFSMNKTKGKNMKGYLSYNALNNFLLRFRFSNKSIIEMFTRFAFCENR